MLARSIIAILVSLVLAGCAVNRFVLTPFDHLTFAASRDLNPDDGGRPSPIAVKVYQLTSRTTFDNLDFDAVFSNAKVVLSDELISQSELVLQPGGRQALELELDARTAFIAIAAGYRHIDRARWRLVLPVNGNWYYSHDIALSANGVREGLPRQGPAGEQPEPATRTAAERRAQSEDIEALRKANGQ